MKYMLSRRRFAQLAIASCTGVALFQLTSKTIAQQNLLIVGLQIGPAINSSSVANLRLDSLDDDSDPTVTYPEITQEISFASLNEVTGQAEKLPLAPVTLAAGEEVTGFTALTNGTMVVAITPASNSKKDVNPTRLVFLSTPNQSVTISGLKKQEKLGSLVGTSDGRLLGLVSRKDNKPPFRLVDINIQSGAINASSRVKISGNDRLTNLAQCDDGNMYAIATDKSGDTSLVNLNSQQKTPITVNKQVWNSGFKSLICSSANQLFAFGSTRYESRQYLYVIDPQTGNMTIPKEFEANQIAVVRQ